MTFFITFKKYIFSILISLAVTLILLALISVAFSFFSPSMWILDAVSDYSFAFTALLASFLSARASSGKGLLTGIFTAFLCLVLLSLGGEIFFKSVHFLTSLFKSLPIGLICGALGGIAGINSK